MIDGADGQWCCDNDSGEGLNAQIILKVLQAGTCDMWVGTFGGGTTAALLHIAELP
jgi:hypothetical protein